MNRISAVCVSATNSMHAPRHCVVMAVGERSREPAPRWRALMRFRKPCDTAPAFSTSEREALLYSLNRSSTRCITSGPSPWKDRAYSR